MYLTRDVRSRLRQEVSANKKALAQDRLKLLLLQKEKTQELQARNAQSQSLQEDDDDNDNLDGMALNPGEKVLALMHRRDSDSQLSSHGPDKQIY
jgi:hypothetical protein